MSDRSRSAKKDIDYRIFHKTGQKVIKEKKSEKMDLNGKRIKEMQVFDDLKEAFALYLIEELETVEEILEGINQINGLGREYRHIHIELKSIMSNEDYTAAYTKCEEVSERVRKFLKEGKAKSKQIEKDVKVVDETKIAYERMLEEEKERQVKEEEEKKVRSYFVIDEQTFQERLESEIANFTLTDVDEIKANCARFELLLDDYYKLLGRAKIVYGQDFEIDFKDIFDKTIIRIREQIKIGKSKIKELFTEIKENLAAEKATNEKLARDAFLKEQKFNAQTLANEIEMRSNALVKKCDSENLKSLDDHQILERNKNLSFIDTEMREILHTFTAFSKIAVLCGDEKEELLVKPRGHQTNALKARNAYAKELYSVVADRDISEEKLKNSSGLSIDLSKFKGYESKLDIYSFRTEFQKLIQPTIQKRYWLDMLKKNYLAGPAFILVEKSETIEDVWTKLTDAYGNVKLLLQNKISNLDKLECLDKVKGDEKIGIAIAKIINMMTELSNLAQEHKLEYKLYVGGGLEKIFSLIGEGRERKYLTKNVEKATSSNNPNNVLEEKLEWENLKKFLKQELTVRERLTLMQKTKNCMGIHVDAKKSHKDDKGKPGSGSSANTANTDTDLKCYICEKKGHILSVDKAGRKYVDYFSCKTFVDMSPHERRTTLQSKNLCLQCLSPGMKYNDRHRCYDKYICTDSYHKKYPKGLHVLICEAHKKNQSNIDLLAEYKKNIISKRSDNFENFTKNISLVCQNGSETFQSTFGEANDNILPDVGDSAIFMLQTINVERKNFNIFYDSGCGDVVVKKSAIDILVDMGRARLEVPGPITLSGVGDHKSVCEHGIYSIRLPLRNGQDAILSGVCLDRVTSGFPKYALKNVENDIRKVCKKEGGSSLVKTLPKLSKEVGGDTDILIGIKYLKYHPQKVWDSPTGLSLSESAFLSADGTTGVIGGPHPEFTKTDRKQNSVQTGKADPFPAYFSPVIDYRNAYRASRDMPLLGVKHEISDKFRSDDTQGYQLEPWPWIESSKVDVDLLDPSNVVAVQESSNTSKDQPTLRQDEISEISVSNSSSEAFAMQKAPRCVKMFDEIETAGTEVTYRCVGCRNCQECKRSSRIDAISIQEEIEQEIINNCVEVNVEKNQTSHLLPFLTNPETKLVPNEKFALKIYESQMRGLDKKPIDKAAAIEFDDKLQRLGYVDYLDNLPNDVREAILSCKVKYFIPWRVVFNENSTTTPCRLVFDASCCPRGGCSLNSLLAKGTNNMNKLIVILISWTGHLIAFHTDIRKMYNTIILDKRHWQYQLYFWDGDLRVGIEPRIKVIKTAIYGVRPSGNIAECGIRKTAELTKLEYPNAYNVINKDLYVDDCFSGEKSVNEADQLTDQLTIALGKGGFILKGFTFSGRDPLDHLSSDGKSVVIGGIRWFCKEDLISLNIPELNFVKKQRGRKSKNAEGKIPENFTKRNCVSRVAEIFDPLGRVTPLISGLKLDLNQLTLRKLNWDDVIPNDLRQIWKDNFEMINEIGNVRFKRAVIPNDAVDINVETIDTADASQKMICVAIYARFRLKSGGHSCQLVFARSKIVPQDMSQPRAELLAAEMNASTGHVVKTSFGDKHKNCLKLTDSQVALHWIGCKRSKLKLWVRNRVIEINRLVSVDNWRYVESKNMIADLGTRKGMTVTDVGQNSDWINGFEWMRGVESEFPTKTKTELILDAMDKQDFRKEIIINVPSECNDVLSTVHTLYVPSALGDRYVFSQYLLDPNRFRFRKVVRVLGLVFLFLNNVFKKCKECKKSLPKNLLSESNDIPHILSYHWDKYLVTNGRKRGSNVECKAGLVVDLPKTMINAALKYYFIKATEEIKYFLPESKYKKFSEEKDGILFYIGRILPTQKISGDLTLCDTSFDLSKATFCVPIIDIGSPTAYAIANEIHWYHPDVKHGGIESVLRQVQCIAHLIGGRKLIIAIKKACSRCRLLEKREIRVTMGPKHESNLCIAPSFHNTQVDICGPFESYSNANKRAKIKIWLVVFCCCATGAIDSKVMEDYSTDSFILAFIRFSCRYGYPCKLFPDYGSQLIKGCNEMVLSFSDVKYKLSTEYGVAFETCPVGAHYVHGKIERKIQQIKKSIEKNINNHRLSLIQWETLSQQVANTINNLPLGLGNKVDGLENLDLLTPNRLLLGRNNSRGPTAPLALSRDIKKIIETNSDIFKIWFKSWLVSYVPTLIEKPKWFESDEDVSKGDIILFLKSEKEFEHLYQYGMISKVFPGKDGRIRSVQIEYQNQNETTKRNTNRGVRDIVVIHPIDELGISRELYDLANDNVPS